MRAVPRLCGLCFGICLTTEEKSRRNLSQNSRRVPVTCTDVLQVWLMSLPLEDEPYVFQHDRLPPHINTAVCSWIGSGPRDDTVAPTVSTSWPPWCTDLAPSTLREECCERWDFPVTLNDVKDRIRTVGAKTEHFDLQSVWHEVEYFLGLCRATNDELIEFA